VPLVPRPAFTADDLLRCRAASGWLLLSRPKIATVRLCVKADSEHADTEKLVEDRCDSRRLIRLNHSYPMNGVMNCHLSSEV